MLNALKTPRVSKLLVGTVINRLDREITQNKLVDMFKFEINQRNYDLTPITRLNEAKTFLGSHFFGKSKLGITNNLH